MAEISKADWKLFCERVPEWQEHYMERLTKARDGTNHMWSLSYPVAVYQER